MNSNTETNTEVLNSNLKKGNHYLVMLKNEKITKVFYNEDQEFIFNDEDIEDQIKIIYTPEFDKLQPIMYDNE